MIIFIIIPIAICSVSNVLWRCRMLKVVREEQVERLIKQLGEITGDTADAANSSTQKEVPTFFDNT